MKLTEIARFTTDVDNMAAFYQALLGSDPVARSESMAIFMHGDVKIFIHATYTPGENDLPPEDHHAFTVENVDETCHELKHRGLTVEIEPRDYYWGRSAYLRDPNGNLVELIQQD